MYSAIGVEPTKLTAAMSGCASSASTASLSPCTTLNTPSGRPGLLQQLGQQQRRRRIALGRLQHERVAAGERHREHPHRHHRREIERRDAGDDAQRLAQRPVVDAAADVVGELALQQLRDAAGELDDLDAALHFALRVADSTLPCSCVIDGRKRLGLRSSSSLKRNITRARFERRRLAPRRQRTQRRVDRCIDVGRRRPTAPGR